MKVINLFAGPGAGKSTSASQLFYLMKTEGFKVELVTEFAKDLTWSRSQSLSCQPYVFGNQLVRIHMLKDQVDYVITDSPILLSCVYNASPELTSLAMATFKEYDNFNILLNRTKPYAPYGRTQTLNEAEDIDSKIRKFLDRNKIGYLQCDGSSDGIDRLFNLYIKNEMVQNEIDKK